MAATEFVSPIDSIIITDVRTATNEPTFFLVSQIQPFIPVRHHDALKENISLLQNLLPIQYKTTADLSKDDFVNFISNIMGFLETFDDIFNYVPPILTAQGLNSSVSSVNSHDLDKPVKKFREVFRKQLRGMTFLRNDIRKKTQAKAISESLKEFDKICILGKTTKDEKVKNRINLHRRMELEGEWIEKINTYRKRKVIEAIQYDLYTNYQDTLQNEYPKLFEFWSENSFGHETAPSSSVEDGKRDYYAENELLSFTNGLISTVLSDFKEQISFEDDHGEIAKLIEEMERKLREEQERLVNKNFENQRQARQLETDAALKQSLQMYQSQMGSVLNSTPISGVSLISIENQHENLKMRITQEFEEKVVHTGEPVHNALQKVVFEGLRELMIIANAKATEEMEKYRKLCRDEISGCLRNVESHLAQLSKESPKHVGILRSQVGNWLEETMKAMSRGTILNKEEVESLLKRVEPDSPIESFSEMTEETMVAEKFKRIKSMVTEATKKFIEMVEACRRKNGLAETIANSIRNQVKSQLEFEIKATFGDHEPTEQYVRELDGHMKEYVVSKMVNAMESLDKKLNSVQVSSTLCTPVNAVNQEVVKVEIKMELNIEDNNSYEYGTEIFETYDERKVEVGDFEKCKLFNNLGEPQPHSPLDTTILKPEPDDPVSLELIFHLSITTIQMAGFHSTPPKSEMLRNSFGNWSTPLAVGLTTKGCFIYGPEIDICTKNKTLLQTFDVGQLLNHDLNFPWSTEGIICGKVHKVTVEVLLAFLLSMLKTSAEKTLEYKCSKAVIAVPYWLASSQRIQVKDAGKIAGFSEVCLVNDLSAAAFAFVTSLRKKTFVSQTESIIMVLSAHANIVEVGVYSVNQAYPTVKLEMLSHCVRSQTIQINKNEDKATDIVMEMCNEALSKVKFSNEDKTRATPTSILVICGDSDHIWRKVLETVRMEYTGNSHCLTLNENIVVLTGAIMFAQNLKELGSTVKDKIDCKFWRARNKSKSAKTGKGAVDIMSLNFGPMFPSYGKIRKSESKLASKDTTANYYQSGLAIANCNDSQNVTESGIPIGYLKICDKYPEPSSGTQKQFIPILTIDHEGIISLDHVLVATIKRTESDDSNVEAGKKKRKRSRRTISLDENPNSGQHTEYHRLLKNDRKIQWSVPNLNKVQITSFKKLLTEINEKIAESKT